MLSFVALLYDIDDIVVIAVSGSAVVTAESVVLGEGTCKIYYTTASGGHFSKGW